MTQPGEDLHEFDNAPLDSGPDVEVPEADAYEQAVPADPAGLPAELRMPPEANEADVYEQSLVVDIEDDYR